MGDGTSCTMDYTTTYKAYNSEVRRAREGAERKADLTFSGRLNKEIHVTVSGRALPLFLTFAK